MRLVRGFFRSGKPVVTGGNITTCRSPDDLPAFCECIVQKLRRLQYQAALATLLAAADSAAATGTAHLPDLPAVLTALVALHAAEFDLARGVLDRAGGGERHTLLLAWTAMLRGDLATAEAHRAAVRRSDAGLAPRDELFLHGLELGLARRGGTPEAVRERWGAAYEAVMRQPVDLFGLLPLGEILVAAARIEEGYRVTMHRDRAFTLLERHGSPVLWSAWLHWAAFHAAIVSGDGATARKVLRPLATASDSGPLARAFAAAVFPCLERTTCS